MKTFAAALVFLSLTTLSGQALHHAQADELTLSNIQGSLSGQLSGSILKLVYERLGMTIDFDFRAADVSARRATAGETDGEVQRIAQFGDTHPTLIRVDEPLFALDGVAFTKGVRIDIDGPASLRPYKTSLRPYRIGIQDGVLFSEDVTHGMNPIRAPSVTSLFNMLDRGMVDAVITTRITGLHTIKRLRLAGIAPLEPPLVRIDLYHYLHRRHMDLVPKVAATIRRLRAEGVIDGLFNAFVEWVS